MDNLLQLVREFQARLSDPDFEAQTDDLNQRLVSALADLSELRELQRALFNFRNAASAVKTQCGKVNQRSSGIALSPVAGASDLETETDVEGETGNIVRLQTFMRDGSKEEALALSHDDPLLLALLRFRVAAQGLHEAWQKTDGTHAIDTPDVYPFQESFEDLLSKISAWTEATFRRADGYCASCCIPDHAQCSLTAGCPCCDTRNA